MRLLQDLYLLRRALSGFALIGFGWSAFAAQVPALKMQIGASDGLFGTLLLVGAFGALCAMLTAPRLARVLGRMTLPVAALATGGGFLLSGLAQGPVVFTLALFLAAGGSGVIDVIINAEVSVRETESRRSLMNLGHGFFSVCYSLGALLAGLARGDGWAPTPIFLGVVLAALVMLPLMRVDLRDPEPDGETRHGGLPHLLVITGGLVVLAVFMTEAATETWSALHLERSLGGLPQEGAMGPTLLALFMAVGRLGGHFLSNQLPERPVMFACLSIAVLGCALMATARTLPEAYLGVSLIGLGVSVVGPLGLAIVGRSVPRHLRLKAMSRAVTLGYGAIFIGPPIMGYVAQAYGLGMSFAVLAGILLLTLFIALPLLMRLEARASVA